MAVLKGDAYGHGIRGVYPTLHACGVDAFAVGTWEEGALLRSAGAAESILVLGDTCDGQLENLLTYRLTPAIFSLETAQKLNLLASWRGERVPVHIKLDTGMNRIGFPADESSLAPILEIARLPYLHIEGMFTHFARADEPGEESVREPLTRFLHITSLLEREGVPIPCRHAANSPAVLLHPETQLDMVRVGDNLFGLCSVDERIFRGSGLRQVLSWVTVVAMTKWVPSGTPVGYGGSFVTGRDTCIATLPVGFADGLDRRLSNCGAVRIHGRLAPIIGRVCMNQCMVDVTDIGEVRRGDTATLLDADLTVDMARQLHTVADEVVCSISSRVPRRYVGRFRL